jgi:putative nucleotidyltransferase with HDIG domain
MSPELEQRLADAVDRMPAFPQSVQKVLHMTRDITCAPKDLVQVIENDPLMTLKVLRVVNSAQYGLPKKVTTIGHSVVYLGLNTIKNLALSIAAIGMLPKVQINGFDTQQYLIHSLATASIAKQLANRMGDVDPMDCFIAGLLHDFGKVVFAQHMPQEFQKALEISLWNESPLNCTLQEIIGADHAIVGALLAEKWRFAPSLVETIRSQFDAILPDTSMVACVFAANQISKKLKLGFGGNVYIESFPQVVAKRLGGDMDCTIASLGDVQALQASTLVFATM